MANFVAKAGYGWENADLTGWQCTPALMSGPVLTGGAGVDVPVLGSLAVGLEYRVTTLPYESAYCTAAFFPEEPDAPPRDFLPQRIAVTFAVLDAF